MKKNSKNYDFFEKNNKKSKNDMVSQNDVERMRELISLIEKYNYNYYTLDNPIVSDREYDKVYDELVEIEKRTSTILPNSPTQRVGGEVLSGFVKHRHEYKLYSLSKVRSFPELEKWMVQMRNVDPKTDFALEYKYDGLQLVLEYENGAFVRATTRGNGIVGEDVTMQVKTIPTVPLDIKYKGRLIVQGEGMMTKKALDIFNRTAPIKLKNTRNGVAGAIRNLDPKETAKRRLTFFCYSIIYCDESFLTQESMHNFLMENGFNVGDFFEICTTVEQVIDLINKVGKTKNDLDIDIDGMVIKINNTAYRNEIGFTSKFPKWAMAYKFEATEVSTTLLDVKWQVGRTGRVTPIAILEPVELAGANISRATLNNIDDIKRKELSIGSRVLIRRSNEVIPEVLGCVEKVSNAKEITAPKYCPCCGSELMQENMLLYCPNKLGCLEQIIDRAVHFASRNAMNIEGFSSKTAEALHEVLGFKMPSDLYTYTHEDFLKLEKFKEKKSKNLEKSIKNSKKVDFSRFLFALGIAEVGEKTAREIAKKFKNLTKLKNATPDELTAIDDIGEVVAGNIVNFFKDEVNLSEIKRLLSLGVEVLEQEELISHKLAGLKIVITGTLSKPRSYFVDIIDKNGGMCQSSVSKLTDYVLAGQEAGSKLEKAKALGIKVISEEEFYKLI